MIFLAQKYNFILFDEQSDLKKTGSGEDELFRLVVKGNRDFPFD